MMPILEMSGCQCQKRSIAYTEEAGADDEKEDEWSLSCVRVEPTRKLLERSQSKAAGV